MRVRPKGELLSWGLFGGIALVGWVWTIFIRGGKLESDDYVGDADEESDGDDDHDTYHRDINTDPEQGHYVDERLSAVIEDGGTRA